MTLLWVRARVECEACGKGFTVALDSGLDCPLGWSVFDLAKDAVRGGEIVEEAGKRIELKSSSVQDDKMLCGACTDDADAAGEET